MQSICLHLEVLYKNKVSGFNHFLLEGPKRDACGIDIMERISDDLDNNNEYSQEEFDLISPLW